jgi:hypothetical protein
MGRQELPEEETIFTGFGTVFKKSVKRKFE